MGVRVSPLPMGEGLWVRANSPCLPPLDAYALIPHPGPPPKEEGIKLPFPHGRGAGGEGCSPLPMGEGLGVRAAPLSPWERGWG